MPEITIPLDIPDIEIVSSEFKDNRFILQVRSTIEGTTCHRCKKWVTKRGIVAKIYCVNISRCGIVAKILLVNKK